MIRWPVQIIVMISDIVIWAAIGFILWTTHFNWLVDIICFFAYITWKNSGGFEEWKPSNIKMFLKNAKEIGW